MKRLFFVLILYIFTLPYSFGQFSPGYFALKDVWVIDLVSKKLLPHFTIVIHHHIIEAIGPSREINIPDSASVLNYAGKFVMPGLIDTHVHLATDPTGDDNRARAERDLRDMLLSGITTVRDMAGDARALASLSRDASLDEIISPDIYYSALMAGPGFFKDPRTVQSSGGRAAGDVPWMRAVTDSTDLRAAVSEAKGTGATAIKLYAELSAGLAKKITAEAHLQNMLVWSHANLDQASALDVINAGVNSISHAPMITGWPAKKIPDEWVKAGLSEVFWDKAFNGLPVNDLINAMIANKTILDATLVTFKSEIADPAITPEQQLKYLALYQIGRRFTKLALSRGIPVCTGTDLDEKKFVQREIKLLVKDCAVQPIDALICATRCGAMAIGIEKYVGTIEKGKLADLVVLSADPTENIDNLDKVELVIKNGKLFSKSH